MSLGCLYYFHTKVCLQVTSVGDLNHVGTSKLIFEANRWTGFCVMSFLPKDCSEQIMILHLCKSGECTTVLCFTIRGGDVKVSPPSCTWSIEGFLKGPLMCWIVTGLGCVFTLVLVRFSDVKKIPHHCNNLTLELFG